MRVASRSASSASFQKACSALHGFWRRIAARKRSFRFDSREGPRGGLHRAGNLLHRPSFQLGRASAAEQQPVVVCRPAYNGHAHPLGEAGSERQRRDRGILRRPAGGYDHTRHAAEDRQAKFRGKMVQSAGSRRSNGRGSIQWNVPVCRHGSAGALPCKGKAPIRIPCALLPRKWKATFLQPIRSSRSWRCCTRQGCYPSARSRMRSWTSRVTMYSSCRMQCFQEIPHAMSTSWRNYRERAWRCLYIVSTLAAQIRSLVVIRRGLDAGRPFPEVMSQVRARQDQQKALESAARRISAVQLTEALLQLAKIDRISKGIGHGDAWDELVQLGLRFAIPGRRQ